MKIFRRAKTPVKPSHNSQLLYRLKYLYYTEYCRAGRVIDSYGTNDVVRSMASSPM